MTAAEILAYPTQLYAKLAHASDTGRYYAIAAGQSGADAQVLVTGAVISFPFPVFDMSMMSDTQAFGSADMGQILTDRLCGPDDTIRIFLPSFADVGESGQTLAIRSTRMGAAGKFGIYPAWADIQGSYGRRLCIGPNLCQFSAYPMEAGQTMLLTPRLVNQRQLQMTGGSGPMTGFTVGAVVTGSDSEATGRILYVDIEAGVIQITPDAGSFTGSESLTTDHGGSNSMVASAVNCDWMWVAELVTGIFPDLDKNDTYPSGWYNWWF